MLSKLKALQNLAEWTGRAIAWLTLLMVLITFAVVVLRYVFNLGWIAMQESITYLHAMVFMLGIAYTLKHQAHVRVDIFYQTFSQRTRAYIDLFGTLFLLLPMMGFIFWISWDYVIESWKVLEGSREAGGLPGVFLLKSLLLLMPVLVIIQALALIADQILKIKGQNHD